MITYTQAYTRAANIVGINPTTDSQDLTNIQQDINQALRLFKNAARRYWTRTERTANLVAGQQYYELPPDCVRVTEVKLNTGTIYPPLKPVDSEAMWNKLNVIPSASTQYPQFYFIRGANEIGIWPAPSTTISGGLDVSYEPRLPDMTIDDILGVSPTLTAAITSGTTQVTLSSPIVVPTMVGRWFSVTDGTDGNWYKIATYTSSTVFQINNAYQGLTVTAASFTIGQAADIPEDYHLAMVYFACYNFFLKRDEQGSALMYKALFEDLLKQYKEVYAAKTTGGVLEDLPAMNFNLWNLPPQPMS